MSLFKKLDIDVSIPEASADISDIRKMGDVVHGSFVTLSKILFEFKWRLNLLIDGEMNLIQLQPQTKAPLTGQTKTGTIAYADGTNWNPGGGEGVYRYGSDAAWHLLG